MARVLSRYALRVSVLAMVSALVRFPPNASRMSRAVSRGPRPNATPSISRDRTRAAASVPSVESNRARFDSLVVAAMIASTPPTFNREYTPSRPGMGSGPNEAAIRSVASPTPNRAARDRKSVV